MKVTIIEKEDRMNRIDDMDDNLSCAGCSKPICTGDNILVLDFNEDTPASLVHLELDCLLKLPEVSYGTLGQGIVCNVSMMGCTSSITRIK